MAREAKRYACPGERDRHIFFHDSIRKTLVDEVEIFSGLEANGLSGGDADLGASARIAAHAGLSGFDGEDAEAAQLDTVALGQSPLHGFEDGVNGGLGLDPGKSGAFDDTLNEILLNQ
jgi:hypothetical protein